MRFRFTSPHPKDYPDELLYLMRDRHNVCKLIHMPAQSGSSAVLERMRRGYTREAYLELVQKIRSIIPDVGLSSDFLYDLMVYLLSVSCFSKFQYFLQSTSNVDIYFLFVCFKKG
jgi:hypothetical protein